MAERAGLSGRRKALRALTSTTARISLRLTTTALCVIPTALLLRLPVDLGRIVCVGPTGLGIILRRTNQETTQE